VVACVPEPYSAFAYFVGARLTYAASSWHGFAASLIAQSSILLVNEFVEKPHFRRLCAVAERPKNASRSRISWNH
jgi:hypothetical protein